jgi:hypothetical protein
MKQVPKEHMETHYTCDVQQWVGGVLWFPQKVKIEMVPKAWRTF